MQSDQDIILGVTFIIFQTAEAALLFRAYSQSHKVLHSLYSIIQLWVSDQRKHNDRFASPGRVFLNHNRIMITSFIPPIRMSWLLLSANLLATASLHTAWFYQKFTQNAA